MLIFVIGLFVHTTNNSDQHYPFCHNDCSVWKHISFREGRGVVCDQLKHFDQLWQEHLNIEQDGRLLEITKLPLPSGVGMCKGSFLQNKKAHLYSLITTLGTFLLFFYFSSLFFFFPESHLSPILEAFPPTVIPQSMFLYNFTSFSFVLHSSEHYFMFLFNLSLAL